MLIHLPNPATKESPEKVCLNLSTRLPAHVISPCSIDCTFFIEPLADYSLLHRSVKAKLMLRCQRCLQDFSYDYAQSISMAVCSSEDMATKLNYAYESIVTTGNTLDLLDLITDDLYFLTPLMHDNLEDCEKTVAQFISGLC